MRNQAAGSTIAVFASILSYQNVETPVGCDGLLDSVAISTTPHKLIRHHHHLASQRAGDDGVEDAATGFRIRIRLFIRPGIDLFSTAWRFAAKGEVKLNMMVRSMFRWWDFLGSF